MDDGFDDEEQNVRLAEIARCMGALPPRSRLEIMRNALNLALEAGNIYANEHPDVFFVQGAVEALDRLEMRGSELQVQAAKILLSLIRDDIDRAMSYPVIPELAYGQRQLKTVINQTNEGYDTVSTERLPSPEPET